MHFFHPQPLTLIGPHVSYQWSPTWWRGGSRPSVTEARSCSPSVSRPTARCIRVDLQPELRCITLPNVRPVESATLSSVACDGEQGTAAVPLIACRIDRGSQPYRQEGQQ
jgi:hypothetical protein